MKQQSNIKFNVFESAISPKTTKMDIKTILKCIESNKKKAKNISNLQFEAVKKKKKLELPVALFQCEVENTKDNIVGYKNYIIIDIDKIDDINHKYKIICEDVFTRMSFISPSGNGIKILIETDLDLSMSKEDIESYHQFTYEYLTAYYSNIYGLDVDKSGSNINRLCYLASEFPVYLNEDSSIVETKEVWKRNKEYKNININSIRIGNKRKSPNDKTILEKAYSFFKGSNIDGFEEYVDWLKLGFIIYSILGDNGFTMFDEFSKLSANKYNPKSVKRQWFHISKSFDEEKVGSVKFLVKKMLDNGYQLTSKDILLKNNSWSINDYPQIKKELKIDICRDEITKNLFISYKGGKMIAMDDSIVNQIISDIWKYYNKSLPSASIKTVMFNYDNIRSINFIKDKLDSIRTNDPTEFEKIKNYFITMEGKELTEKILKRWMLGSMKNVFDTYYDEILSLKGGQGMGKTTWITGYLLSPFSKWVSTSFYWDMKSPDQLKQLTDKMFIYDMENTSLTKAETSQIKKVTSMEYVKYRSPYDKYSIDIKRISTFIMDSNEKHIFNDSTGARRFLILTMKSMNIYDNDGGELKKIDYNKVWGYIYDLWCNGITPSSIDITGLDIHKDESRLKNDLEHAIDDAFEDSGNTRDYLTFSQIIDVINQRAQISGMRLFGHGDYNNTKVGKILSKFKSKSIKLNGKSTNVYFIKESKLVDNNEIKIDTSDITAVEQMTDNILDNIVKNKYIPTPEEIEILKKLNSKLG